MADCCQPQPACSGLFRDLVHAGARHATRISKPRSTGTSPSASSASKQRRTTTTGVMPQRNSAYHRPAPGGPSMESALLASTIRQNHRRSRPMSWHPAGQSSTPQYIPPSSTVSTAASINMSALALPPSLNDPSLYGDDTTMLPPSYPLPSSDLPISDDSFPSLSGMQDPLSFLPMGQTAWDAPVPDLCTAPQPLSDGWTLDMLSMNNDIPSVPARSYYESVPSSGDLTGPSTPDLLPLQPHDGYEPESTWDTKDENELVGMGLYNQPESFQGPTSGVLGKGLKLEETFTPSPDDDNKNVEEEDDDNDASNDEQADADPEPQESEPIKPVKPSMNLLSQSFLFDDDSLDQHAVPDAQQLFSMNQPCMNYGYRWI